MAVMTAKCDRPFVVSADKADMFEAQKKDEAIFNKINVVASKIEKNLKTENEK